MIYIGIDTGVNTGFAVWDNRKREFLELETVKIHQAMQAVLRYKAKADADGTKLIVRVEDPRQRTWFGTEKMSRDEERKRLQGVGSVKRDAVIWDDYLSYLGIEYQMVAPKNNATKLPQTSFKSITGYEKRTNEHSRDAAMLVFGF